MTNSTWRFHNTVTYLVKIKGRPATSHERSTCGTIPLRFFKLVDIHIYRKTFYEKNGNDFKYTSCEKHLTKIFFIFSQERTFESRKADAKHLLFWVISIFREFTPGTVLRVFGYCNCVKRFCCDAVVQKEVETFLQILQRRNAWYTWCDFEASIALRDAFV